MDASAGGGWRVLIVEDDPMVAHVHRQMIELTPGLRCIGVAESGRQAIDLLSRTAPHLLLLDLAIPGVDGLSLLRRIRAAGGRVEVIAVTAARDRTSVQRVAQLGALDYLVKPFSHERLKQAFARFLHRMATLQQAPDLEQENVDTLLRGRRVDGRLLPRGLSDETLTQLRDELSRRRDPAPAEAIGSPLGLSRVTARRYLEYLVTIGEAVVADVHTGEAGRPRKQYRARDPFGSV